MKLTRRQALPLLASTLAAPAIARSAFAQAAWPTRAIKAMVPFSAGSTADIIPRIVFDQLSQQLGQSIVVENRGGAGGTVGAAMVAKADADGYTWLVNASAHTAAPALYPNLSYDAAKDFSAVIPLGNTPSVTVVSPSKGIKTLQELVERARANPGKLTFASAGVGSATHIAGERLRAAGKFEAVHVPFRGGPEGLTETMTGRVDFYCCGISSALSFIQSGQLIPLAVSTQKRTAILPNIATSEELGFANSHYNFWTGILMPAKTPKPIIDRIHAETTKALQNATVQEKLSKQGVEPLPMTPAEYDAVIRDEIASNMVLLKDVKSQ